MPSANTSSNSNSQRGGSADAARQAQSERELAEKVSRRVYQIWLEEMRIERERRGKRKG
jgi:glutathione synthase/RimK-type ligase-like ATP-grasp enzyme